MTWEVRHEGAPEGVWGVCPFDETWHKERAAELHRDADSLLAKLEPGGLQEGSSRRPSVARKARASRLLARRHESNARDHRHPTGAINNFGNAPSLT